jgi:hypothetical protein
MSSWEKWLNRPQTVWLRRALLDYLWNYACGAFRNRDADVVETRSAPVGASTARQQC